MIKITRFFYISILCFPLFIVSYFTNSLQTMLLAYSVALVHELFHLLASLLLCVRIKSIIIMPFGMTLRLADGIIQSPQKEIAIALSGPFANLMMLAIGKIVGIFIGENASIFLFNYLNIIMFFINMLPCMPLDGGRVLRAFLTGKIGYVSAEAFQKKVEKIIVAVLFIAGILLIIITEFNISLVMIAAFLLFELVNGEERKNYVIMREIMNSPQKLAERKYMLTKVISARGDVKALDVIKRTGYDTFYVINVIDDKMHIKKSITECEMIDGIKRNNRIKLMDL